MKLQKSFDIFSSDHKQLIFLCVFFILPYKRVLFFFQEVVPKTPEVVPKALKVVRKKPELKIDLKFVRNPEKLDGFGPEIRKLIDITKRCIEREENGGSYQPRPKIDEFGIHDYNILLKMR